MPADDTTIPLSTLLAADGEQTFSGRPLAAGVHLRWSYPKRLGPPRTFEVFKITPGPLRVEERRLAELRALQSPAEELWERVRTEVAGDPVLADRYRLAASELVRLFQDSFRAASPETPLHQVVIPQTGGRPGRSTRVYLLDALLLASLDPYLARMQALYWIDPDVSTSGSEYFVRGHWGSRPWPLHLLDFTTLTPRPFRDGPFVLDDVEFALRRVYVASDDIQGVRLVALGHEYLPLEIRLPRPTRALTLRIVVHGPPVAWSAMVDGVGVSPTVSSDQLRLRLPDGQAFRQVWLFGPGTTWNLYHLAIQEREGAIGTLESEHVRVERPSGTELAPPVVPPRLAELRPRAIPATLDGVTGEVPASSSQVEVVATLDVSPEDPYRPVRLLAGRSPNGHAGEPAELVTMDGDVPSPTVFQTVDLPGPLPELLAHFPLDGHARDLRTGEAVSLNGPTRFVRGHPEDPSRRVLELGPGGFGVIADRQPLQSPGSNFTIQLWINPAPGQTNPVLLGNARDSYSLGLRALPDGNYLPRLWLNATAFEGATVILPRTWTRLTVAYDGTSVRFYLGKNRDASRPASLGPVRPNPRGTLAIGAESGSTRERAESSFRGRLADVSVWQRALHPLELNDRLEEDQHALAAYHSTAELIAAWPEVLEIGTDLPFVEARQPELQSTGTGLTLELWLKPEPGLDFPTLIGNGWEESFWLGLHASADGYVPRLWLNRPPHDFVNPFHGRRHIPANEWSRLNVTYDGAHVRFYLNGREDAVHVAARGPIRPNPQGTLVLGADSGSTPDRLLYPYRGGLAEVRIWQRSLPPDEVDRRIASPQYFDRPVRDGTYTYRIRGVDLFGRVSSWSAPRTVDVVDDLPPTPPTFVHGRFLQPAGRITAVGEALVRVTLPTLARALRENVVDAAALEGCDLLVMREVARGHDEYPKLVRQAFEIIAPPQAAERDDELDLELARPAFVQLQPRAGDHVVVAFDQDLEVTWAWTGLSRLFYPRAREFRMYLDQDPAGTLRGSATAAEAVAGARGRFRLTSDVRYQGPAGALEGRWCQVGASVYKVEAHGMDAGLWLELTYEARPVVTPSVGDLVILTLPEIASADRQLADSWSGQRFVEPLRAEEPIRSAARAQATAIDTESIQALADQGVRWLPEGQTYRLVVANPGSAVAGSPRAPDDFVPGALAAFDATASPGAWQAFNVLWEAEQGADLVLYLQYHDPERPDGRPPSDLVLERMRYYRGQAYRRVLPVSTTFAPGEPTVVWGCGLTTADDQTRTPDHRGEAERFGNESAIGQVATAVAVDRRRPPEPPRPEIVSIGRADFYGQSKAQIRWAAAGDPAARVSYLLYRAVDTAIFARDLEQRRLRTGAYEGKTPPEIFEDDIDFADWLPVAARRLALDGLESDWRGRLFPVQRRGPRPGDSPPAEPSAREAWEAARRAWGAWDAVTPFWRAWADRFYPGLTDQEVAELAGRPGNENAFALVQGKPIAGDVFVDRVPGRVTNRYLYRLRTQSAALQGSSGWSPPSAPAAPPKTAPPRAPVFTRVEAGDREIALDWALNTEPDLLEYRLYRAESAEELGDLRWWGDGADPRLVATVPDPRLKVLTDAGRNAVPLLVSPPAPTCVGVYSVDEFDAAAVPLFPQPAAFNYLAAVDDAVGVARLRRIAPGTAVVVLFQEDDDRFQLVDRRSPDPPHVDAGVPGLRDLYYRLTAVNSAGLQSETSAIRKAHATDAQPPEPPTWVTSDRIVGPGSMSGVELAWEVTNRDVRCIVQRRAADRAGWVRVSEWLNDPEPAAGRPGSWRFRFTDENADANVGYEYRIRVESAAGILNAEFDPIYIAPDGG